ncbi:MAG: hypothetical protein II561_08125 [Thermoguttaceae bacterium]|nr:hypothetical protein [Thermoguttaceae bacterium]MBQ2040455.1 hypothetical protein [Thermoguttaceae bacterium]MBQ2556505.1 hypothetical protein [Thermoguttaceae bacterium]MBQ4080873.1 hypothetical protein [Thermoguttaceae bacterium]MBQ4203995.1 hypothetical protein [Thermoguttaceae bacterium]
MSGKTPRKNPINSFLDVVSVCLVLISLVALCFVVTKPYRSKAEPEPAKTAVDGQKRYITKNIEDIRIGERTLGTNPQGRLDSELDESVFQILPHCGFSLRYTSEDGSRCDIRLLRPADWLDWEPTRLCRTSDGQAVDAIDLVSEELASGGFDIGPEYETAVWLDLPEMGIVGWASVVDIDEDVCIEEGRGNVVTGTFAHTSRNVIDLFVEGQTEPIGCTANHPFWSVDRQEFTAAGELREGERLALYSGETKRVVQKLPRPGPEVVYNLEVYGEHVYHVASGGLLVHNDCPFDWHHTIPREIYNPRSKSTVPLLPPELAKDPRIRGVRGSPNMIEIPKDIHRTLHKEGYNDSWREAVETLIKEKGDVKKITVDDILKIREDILAKYDLTKYWNARITKK